MLNKIYSNYILFCLIHTKRLVHKKFQPKQPTLLFVYQFYSKRANQAMKLDSTFDLSDFGGLNGQITVSNEVIPGACTLSVTKERAMKLINWMLYLDHQWMISFIEYAHYSYPNPQKVLVVPYILWWSVKLKTDDVTDKKQIIQIRKKNLEINFS